MATAQDDTLEAASVFVFELFASYREELILSYLSTVVAQVLLSDFLSKAFLSS